MNDILVSLSPITEEQFDFVVVVSKMLSEPPVLTCSSSSYRWGNSNINKWTRYSNVKVWIWARCGVESGFGFIYRRRECAGYFRSVTRYVLTDCFSCFWRFSAVISLVAPKSHSQMVNTETSISAGLSVSGSSRNSISGRTSTSGTAAELPKDQGHL